MIVSTARYWLTSNVSSERKIDLIDRRLDGVYRLLEELKTNVLSRYSPEGGTAPSVATQPSTANHASPSSQVRSDANTSGLVMEGNSSLAAQSVFANDFLQKVVSEDSRPEMRERLDALSYVVAAMGRQPAVREMTYPNARPIPQPTLQGCDLPPIEKALEVLKLAKGS